MKSWCWDFYDGTGMEHTCIKGSRCTPEANCKLIIGDFFFFLKNVVFSPPLILVPQKHRLGRHLSIGHKSENIWSLVLS